MKNFLKLSSAVVGLFALLFFLSGFKSQDEKKIKILYTENDQLKLFTSKEQIKDLGTYSKEVDKSQLQNTDQIIYLKSDIPYDVKLTEEKELYQALKSPHEETWVYIQRDYQNPLGFDFAIFNYGTNEKEILFTEATSPLPGYALAPFAWTNERNKIFVEAINFVSDEVHEGIYELDLLTKNLKKIEINDLYFSTPFLNNDRTEFIYTLAVKVERNTVEGYADAIAIFNLQTNVEKILIQQKDNSFRIIGFPIDAFDVNNIKLKENPEDSNQKVSQIYFHLPYNLGLPYCVSKEGYNIPNLPTCGPSCSYTYGTPYQHTSTKAVDFDTPNNTLDYVRAAYSGTVYIAQNYCSGGGLGKYVAIKHSDNTYAFYGHLNSIYVCQGATVQQGSIIGDGGNMEVPVNNPNCTNPSGGGDHIHFDYRLTSNVSTSANPYFTPYNCVPRISHSYTSQNLSPPFYACPPTGLSVTNITQNSAKLNWTYIQGVDWQIQYRQVNGSWTPASFLNVSNISYYNLSGLIPNTGYQFQIRRKCGSNIFSSWTISGTFYTLPVVNDAPCTPTILSVSTSCSYSSSTNAYSTNSTNVPYPTCGYSSTIKDVWFRFTVPSSGNYTVQTAAGTLTNIGIAIYQGGCYPTYNTLTQVLAKCNYTWLGVQPKLTGSATVGAYLYVRVWGISGATGTFSICARNGIYRFANNEDLNLHSELNPQIFPNPTKNTFKIEYDDPLMQDGNLIIFNPIGQMVYASDIKNETGSFSKEINLENVSSGVYFIKMQIGESIINRKISIER